jgi:hypothetical protein
MSSKTRDDRSIKVHMTCPDGVGEFLWAWRIGKNTAKIKNIPFTCPDLALDDLVRIDKHGEVMEVLEHVAQTRLIRYADPKTQSEEEVCERYLKVRDTVKEHDIFMEGLFPGIAGVSVPLDVSDEELDAIVAQADAEVMVFDEDDDDEEE